LGQINVIGLMRSGGGFGIAIVGSMTHFPYPDGTKIKLLLPDSQFRKDSSSKDRR